MAAVWFRKLSVVAGAAVVAITGTALVAQASPTNLNWGPVSTSQVPPARQFAAMTFDSTRNQTVLWGGGNTAFVNLSDTWEFDGASWVQRTPATSPPALVGSAMAFDANRHVSVMFGGSGSPGDSADTWEWDGTNWTLRTFATSPPARIWTTMAFDSTRGRIVLFGGDGAGSTEFGDTWEYDGLTWTHMSPANSPSPRFGAAMAYDPGLGRVVLFGGRVSGQRMADTWEWDGNNWTQFTPTAAPFPRFWHTMAFDPQVGHVVVFGGDHIEPFGLGPINDTWEWDGAQWTQDWTNASPSARTGQTMALDANGRIVMFGGSDEGNPGVFPTDTEELGTGIVTPAGNPAITFNPTSQEFGNVNVGTTSSAANIGVFSSGTGPVLATISTTGDFAISSTYCPSTPNPLAAGMLCRAFITFTPTAAGDRFGSLVFTGNVSGGSKSVPLHGVGLGSDFTISANPSALNIVQGSTSSSSIGTAVIGGPGTIALSASSSAPGVSVTLTPASISAGGSSTLAVSVAYTTAPGSYTVTVTGTEGSNTHSTLVTVTVTLKGIVNGGFETGDFTGWTRTGITAIVKTPHSGVFAARVGSTSPSAKSTLAQTFTVPAAGGRLVFWYRMTCTDNVENDWFTVTLHDGVTGATSTVLAPVCPKTASWTKATVNLSAHAGHSVTVTFVNHDDGQVGDPSHTLLDDVALT